MFIPTRQCLSVVDYISQLFTKAIAILKMLNYDFYEYQLIVLSTCCFGAFVIQQFSTSRKQQALARAPRADEGSTTDDPGAGQVSTAYSKLSGIYLLVYGMVMLADWLQGPYIYSLYNEQYKFAQPVVAIFFVTGFTTGGLTAPLVGVWADQYGRRRLCLTFCVTYTLSCIFTLYPSFISLFAGRALGGLSTSILFSCFESWLMASASSGGLAESELSKIMGRATFVNGLVAASAGVLSNNLVTRTKNFQTPFIASAATLMAAWLVIKCLWSENYGTSTGETDIFQVGRLKIAWRIVRKDPRLMTLIFTQTCFEGSMYLFVFLWVPYLQDVATSSLPLGNIFASFMVSMMLGSLVYTAIASANANSSDQLRLHAKLSSMVCVTAGLCFAVSVLTVDPRYRFYTFCMFEMCVGMYYPIQGMLRSCIISDEHRATLSALSRVPLNIFVTTSLLTGVSAARTIVFNSCSALLFTSAVTTAVTILRHSRNMSQSQERRST